MRATLAILAAARITPPLAPTNRVLPSLPTPVEGTSMLANAGAWVGNPPVTTATTIIWQSGSSASGPFSFLYGSSASYTPTASDVGSYLRVVVTYTTSAGTGIANSLAVGPVALAAPPSPPAPPVIT